MRFLPLKEGALPGWGTQLQGHFAFRRQSAAVVANGPEWAALEKHRLWNDQPTAEPAFARGPEQGSSGKGDKHRCCRTELHHLELGPLSDSESMRVGTRIKELCAALEGMESATAAEIHQAAFPELDVNSVRRELEPVWAADTRRKLLALGLWPKGVPVPDD